MICGLPALSASTDEDLYHFEEDKAMDCGNLSSTLQKLHMWENKLLEEVKVCFCASLSPLLFLNEII